MSVAGDGRVIRTLLLCTCITEDLVGPTSWSSAWAATSPQSAVTGRCGCGTPPRTCRRPSSRGQTHTVVAFARSHIHPMDSTLERVGPTERFAFGHSRCCSSSPHLMARRSPLQLLHAWPSIDAACWNANPAAQTRRLRRNSYRVRVCRLYPSTLRPWGQLQCSRGPTY